MQWMWFVGPLVWYFRTKSVYLVALNMHINGYKWFVFINDLFGPWERFLKIIRVFLVNHSTQFYFFVKIRMQSINGYETVQKGTSHLNNKNFQNHKLVSFSYLWHEHGFETINNLLHLLWSLCLMRRHTQGSFSTRRTDTLVSVSVFSPYGLSHQCEGSEFWYKVSEFWCKGSEFFAKVWNFRAKVFFQGNIQINSYIILQGPEKSTENQIDNFDWLFRCHLDETHWTAKMWNFIITSIKFGVLDTCMTTLYKHMKSKKFNLKSQNKEQKLKGLASCKTQ